MSEPRRKFSKNQIDEILRDYDVNGQKFALDKYRISKSQLHLWKLKAGMCQTDPSKSDYSADFIFKRIDEVVKNTPFIGVRAKKAILKELHEKLSI